MRIGLTPDGNTGILAGRPIRGRSAYVCRSLECLALALRSDRLRRALRRAVSEREVAEIRKVADCILR